MKITIKRGLALEIIKVIALSLILGSTGALSYLYLTSGIYQPLKVAQSGPKALGDDVSTRAFALTYYKIEPGEQNFTPNENPMPRSGNKWTVALEFNPNCYWPIDDWEGDLDYLDWNKGKGVTGYFSANNNNTAMIAWRPAKDSPGFIEIAAYTNDRSGGLEVTPLGKIFHGVNASVDIYTYSRSVHYVYMGKEVRHDFDGAWLYRETGTWIGGANNSPGKYGGEATQTMGMYASLYKR